MKKILFIISLVSLMNVSTYSTEKGDAKKQLLKMLKNEIPEDNFKIKHFNKEKDENGVFYIGELYSEKLNGDDSKGRYRLPISVSGKLNDIEDLKLTYINMLLEKEFIYPTKEIIENVFSGADIKQVIDTQRKNKKKNRVEKFEPKDIEDYKLEKDDINIVFNNTLDECIKRARGVENIKLNEDISFIIYDLNPTNSENDNKYGEKLKKLGMELENSLKVNPKIKIKIYNEYLKNIDLNLINNIDESKLVYKELSFDKNGVTTETKRIENIESLRKELNKYNNNLYKGGE